MFRLHESKLIQIVKPFFNILSLVLLSNLSVDVFCMDHLEWSHARPAPQAHLQLHPKQPSQLPIATQRSLKVSTSEPTGHRQAVSLFIQHVTCEAELRGVMTFMQDLWTRPLVSPTWHSNVLWSISSSSRSTSFFCRKGRQKVIHWIHSTF